MTDYVLSIDPGLSTGVALLSYDEDTPATLVTGWQFSGGVMGLLRWIGRYTEDSHFHTGWALPEVGDVSFYGDEALTVITEKFTARNTKGFAYTTASLEALRCEGALIALGLMPDYHVKAKRWRDPNGQYIFGGTEKASKKKRQHGWLKANGFYLTGRDFDAPDADDFRSAAAHGVGFIVKELKHKPTWDLVTGESE